MIDMYYKYYYRYYDKILSVGIMLNNRVQYIMQAMSIFHHFWGQVGYSRGRHKADKAPGVLWSGFLVHTNVNINIIYLILVEYIL